MIASVVLELLDADQIAAAGTSIYLERYRAVCEADHSGQIIAIDIDKQCAFVAPSMREACQRARRACPDSIFYFMKIGARAVLTRR